MKRYPENRNKEKRDIWRKKYQSLNKVQISLNQHNYYQRLRLLCLQHYSTEIPFCTCCAEKNLEFLALDHINGGGTQHRKKIGNGTRVYTWLIKNNFPSGFQVLCHNCNMAKAFYKTCPHKK